MDKSKSENLSPEEKLKMFQKAQNRVSRRGSSKSMEPKSATLATVSRKAGRNRDRIEQLEKEVEILKTSIEVLRQEIERPKLDKCPTCGKEFKNLSRHKCKAK